MNMIVSNLNQKLRIAAGILGPNNSLRQAISGLWTRILSGTVGSVDIPICGTTIKVLPKFRHLSPNYEVDTIAVWNKLVEPGGVVWDIGANIGLYSVLSGKLVGRSGEVHAFEPSPVAHGVSVEHVKLNELSGICIVSQTAVSEIDCGVVPFGIVDEEGVDPTNRLGTKIGKTIDVPTASLDGLMSRSKRAPDFIKMDIEGAEVFALRGATDVMTKYRPVILLAVHPMFLPEFGCEVQEIASIVSKRDYASFEMNGTAKEPVEYAEYLLIPSEKVHNIRNRLGWSWN
jgi:FkbM family methyltransferase